MCPTYSYEQDLLPRTRGEKENSLPLRLLGSLPAAEFVRPPGNVLLRRACYGKRVRLHLFPDHAAGGHVDPILDGHGSHERHIRAGKGARADIGEMLVEAIVVAGYGARVDIGSSDDARVTEIGQMIGLRALFNTRVLYFDEISDVNVLIDLRAWPEPCVRPDNGALADFGAFQMRKGTDMRAALHGHARRKDHIG